MASTNTTGSGSAKAGAEKPDLTDDKAAIEEQLARIKSDISELASTLASISTRRAKSVRGEAEDRLHDLSRAGEDAIDDLRAQLRSVERDLTRKAEQKPLQTIGIAAGVGFLVGLVLRR